MSDRAARPIAVRLSCDDLVDFPIEMEWDGQFGYVPADSLPISADLVEELRAFQAFWESLPDDGDADDDDLDDHDQDFDADDDTATEFERVWALTRQIRVTSDPDVAGTLAEEVEKRARGLEAAEQQVLLPMLAEALAPIDPARARALLKQAETLVRRDEAAEDLPRALAELVAAAAPVDPDHAEELIRTIADPAYSARGILASVAALKDSDPQRAERLASRLALPRLREWVSAGMDGADQDELFQSWTVHLLERLRAELGPDYTVRSV